MESALWINQQEEEEQLLSNHQTPYQQIRVPHSAADYSDIDEESLRAYRSRVRYPTPAINPLTDAEIRNPRGWQHKLFESPCSDVRTFVLAWFLPAFVYGDNCARQKRGGQKSCWAHGIWHWRCSLISWILAAYYRGKLRDKYGIQTTSGCDFLEDCAVHTICHSCALTQEKLELDCRAVNPLLLPYPPMEADLQTQRRECKE